MELKEILDFLKRKLKQLIIFLVIGGIFGAGAYYLIPAKFVSTGTFYIARKPEESEEYYTYSGYYAQQVALSYTKTIRGLLENEVLQSKALEDLNIQVTERNLRKLGNKIRVKDAGPQLVVLQVREKNIKKARETWEALATNIINTSTEINKEGDSKLYITRVKEKPVTKETYKDLYVFVTISALLSFGAALLILGLKEHLNGN